MTDENKVLVDFKTASGSAIEIMEETADHYHSKMSQDALTPLELDAYKDSETETDSDDGGHSLGLENLKTATPKLQVGQQSQSTVLTPEQKVRISRNRDEALRKAAAKKRLSENLRSIDFNTKIPKLEQPSESTAKSNNDALDKRVVILKNREEAIKKAEAKRVSEESP